jgi:CubicO group peptidase (beta-lactamase class C family)
MNLMRISLAMIAIVAATAVCSAAPLPRSTPEQQGVASADLLAFVEALDQVDAMNSVMVVRHGHVIGEGWWTPYRAGARHSLYSLSKSFTSTAVGLAVAEGKLSIHDTVLSFFPEDAPENPSSTLKAMRVSDLLCMSTGHQREPGRAGTEPWTKIFLAQEVPFRPGTHFLYNTSGTYMQSAIVQKVTGQTTLDYLRPRLFEPLGIEDPQWETSPQGISLGGYGLSVRTEDIAKFGQLYLQKGMWNGKQLLPAAWVEAATARQTSNGSNPDSDWEQGYGYQFWRCRHGIYRGDGAFGQYCIVMDDHDTVVAMTSGVKNMQAVLEIVWQKLLPALKSSELPAAGQVNQQLTDKLQNLSVRLPEGNDKPGAIVGRTYVFPANPQELETLSIEAGPGDQQVTLVTRAAGNEQRIVCGYGQWIDGQAAWGSMAKQTAAAAAAWKSDELTARLCFYETPFITTLRIQPSGDQITLNAETNVGFSQTKLPELIGKAK